MPFSLRNAPLTKVWLLSTATVSLLVTYRALPFPLSLFAVKPTSDLVVVCFLIYSFRILERHFGTAKYAAFISVSHGMNMLLSGGIFVTSSLVRLKFVPISSCGLIGSALVQFYNTIPPTHSFHLFGLPITNKDIVYVLAAQLMLSRPPSSILSGACGIVAGLLYHSDFWKMKEWRYPKFLRNFMSKYVQPALTSSRPSRGSTPTEATQVGTGSRNAMGGLQGRQLNRALTPPTEEQITMLTAMFPSTPRDRIVEALSMTRNNVDSAVDHLLVAM